MARYLSDEWVADAAAAVASDAGMQAAAAGLEVVVEQRVGDVAYHLRASGGHVALVAGRAERADVVLSQGLATARAIARGELNAQVAFVSGRLRLTGDARVLLDAQPLLASLERALAPVRARTTYA